MMGFRKILQIMCCCFLRQKYDLFENPIHEADGEIEIPVALKKETNTIKENTCICKEENNTIKGKSLAWERSDVYKENTNTDKLKDNNDKENDYEDKADSGFGEYKTEIGQNNSNIGKKKRYNDKEKTNIVQTVTGLFRDRPQFKTENKDIRKHTIFDNEASNGIIDEIICKFKDNKDIELRVLIDKLIRFLKNIDNFDILQNMEITIYNYNECYTFSTGQKEYVVLANYENGRPQVLQL